MKNFKLNGLTVAHISTWILSLLIFVLFNKLLGFHSALVFIFISIVWLLSGITFLIFIDTKVKSYFNIYQYEGIYGPIFWIFSFSALVVGSIRLMYNYIKGNKNEFTQR